MIKAVIFDFDGVILDSADIKTQAFRELFSEYPQDIDAIVDYHIMNSGFSRFVKFRHIYKNILKQNLTEKEELELSEKFSQLCLDKILAAQFVPGVEEFIKKYRTIFPLFIASGTPIDELIKVAKERGLQKYFCEIHGSPKQKPEIIRDILDRHKFKNEQVVFVGDAQSDFQAAQEANVRFISVSDNLFDLPEKIKNMNKTKILFYSGHGEVVGGDAQYLFNLIDNLDPNKYEIKLFTDKSYLFAERAKQWFKSDIAINYLDTKPILFKKNLIQKLYKNVESYQGTNKLIISVRNLLNTDFLQGRSIYRWLNYIYYRIIEIITLAKFRHAVYNASLFYNLFKKERDKIAILHFNNGGYPAKESVLIAIIVAHFCGIKNIIMTILSLAQPRKWYRISDYLYDYFIPKYCNQIITQAKFLSIEFNKRRKVPLDIIENIFLGIDDIPRLSPDEIVEKKQMLGLLLDQPLLLITGGIYSEAKGHGVLLRSMAEVKKKFPTVMLLVAGDGKGLPDLKNLANELALNDNVKFLGYRQDIDELNSIVDIAIVPSIASEGIPYTCIEALRAGKALIVTDAGGCAETVGHGVTGFIIKKNDSAALADAIVKLLENKKLTIKMGDAGRKLFEEKFLLSIEVEKHEDIYSKLKTNK